MHKKRNTQIKIRNDSKEINKKEKRKSDEKSKKLNKIHNLTKKSILNLSSSFEAIKSIDIIKMKDNKDINKTYVQTTPSLSVDIRELKKPVKISPQIFRLYHPKFKPSIYSSENEFKKKRDFIKAYAYNSCIGNTRKHNEDTITATKIYLIPKNKNDYCYFFAIYDGHGGNLCSKFLKNSLHKNIFKFSSKNLLSAIEITEDKFYLEILRQYNSNGTIDNSGSCAIILLIKQNKCIIANIGDSRLVIIKNKKVFFSTIDHKPNVFREKERIEKAGGYIHQSKSKTPMYQNGKLIENPWRVYPGGLSLSRAFGDIKMKAEELGGKEGVLIYTPDITEIDMNEEFNFIVMGSDGIFDVLSNGEIIECIKIVIKLNEGKNIKINQLCGDFASMIIKSALAKESFDNVSCIVIVFNLNDFMENK